MTDIVERLRDGTEFTKSLTPFGEECAEAADEIERNRAAIAELVGVLRYYRDECSGNEPSISVFHRMVDEAIAKHDTTKKEQ